MDHFIDKYSLVHSLQGQIKATNSPTPNSSGFIVKLVEHHTGNAKIMGSIHIDASFFFRQTLQLLKLRHNCDDRIFDSFINLQLNI